MMAKWNEKHTIIWCIVLMNLLPITAVIIGILVPALMFENPILLWLLFIILAVLGFIIVWKQAGKKDKQE